MSTATAECTSCRATTHSHVDAARSAGWRIWDGVSVTGKPLAVRICPVCSGTREGDQPAEAPSWRVGCRTCDWEYEDEYDEGPLSEKDARGMADDHECEPDTWVKPPKAADELAADEARLSRSRVALAVAR